MVLCEEMLSVQYLLAKSKNLQNKHFLKEEGHELLTLGEHPRDHGEVLQNPSGLKMTLTSLPWRARLQERIALFRRVKPRFFRLKVDNVP